MNQTRLKRTTGILFVIGAILVNIPYTLLVINFDYPDILREPAGEVLTRFQDGGSGLILTWFAFAWIGLPLLAAVILLPKALNEERNSWLSVATVLGVTALIVQIIGLLRWVFVVPVLADLYTAAEVTEATQAGAIAAFQMIHQFGGVLLGEHVGQLFIIAWMTMVSMWGWRSGRLPRWLAVLGFVASAVYGLAQAELFATVMPAVPVLGPAGLVGSLLWLLWMVLLGVVVFRGASTEVAVPVPAGV